MAAIVHNGKGDPIIVSEHYQQIRCEHRLIGYECWLVIGTRTFKGCGPGRAQARIEAIKAGADHLRHLTRPHTQRPHPKTDRRGT